MTTSNGRYIFQTASFQCGCVYRTVADTLVFCPVHRQDWHRGAITGTETLELPGPETPEIEGLVMSPYGKDRPEVYRNTDNNSIHTRVQTFDGRQEEWDEHQAEELGLCPACLIDNVDRHETGIAMCECGSDRCSFRWCGSTQGLHAFWHLHAQGRVKEVTGIHDQDIFSHGPCEQHSQTVQDVLDEERARIVETVQNLTAITLLARKSNQNGPRGTFHPAYLNAWFDPDCHTINDTNNPREKDWAALRLAEKLGRLLVIGAMPPPQARLG